MKKLIRLFAVALAAVAAASAFAQDNWPSKPIRIIVPFGAGSGLDALARSFAERLHEQMKTPFIVENKEGAGGTIGALATAHSPADGYTIMLTAHGPFAVAP